VNVRPFEGWKCLPPGFETTHGFVVVSPPEICSEPTEGVVNGFACFTLRGLPARVDVRLNGADGFERPTVGACDFFHVLEKRALQDRLGAVTWERQQQIKAKVKEVFRF
jgi:mRNA-degrading endonuclease toxin of MazEF toxin-antitoxin module